MPFDAKQAVASRLPDASQGTDTTIANAHLLLLGDGAALHAHLLRSLRAAGHSMVEAVTGEEALQAARSESFDLGILDLDLAGTQAIPLLHALKEETGVSSIVLSGRDDEFQVNQALEAGALGYLVTPLAVNQIVPSVLAAIRVASAMRRRHETEVQLKTALVQTRDVSVAIGLVMSRVGISRDAAFEHIRDQARRERRKLGEIARKIVLEIERGQGKA